MPDPPSCVKRKRQEGEESTGTLVGSQIGGVVGVAKQELFAKGTQRFKLRDCKLPSGVF